MKVYVVAGNHDQAYEYINRKLEERIANGESPNKIGDYVYVDSVTRLRGVSNPHGVFVGTWKDRPDILDIVETLYHNSTQVNTSLHRILVQIRKTHKKHDKLTPVQVAADHLAKEIDNQVMKELYEKSQN